MIETYASLCETLEELSELPAELAARLASHERIVRVGDFGLDDAWLLGAALRERAAHLGLPVAISIVLGQQRAFHAALPGAAANNDAWAARKINVVQLFQQSSFRVGVDAALRGSDINTQLPIGEYAAHGGAFPILTAAGALLGVVAISGLPSAHDHALAVVGLAEHAGIDVATL